MAVFGFKVDDVENDVTRLQAIIFDMDGLMVDSEPLSQQAWNQFLRPFGHQLTDAIIHQIVGLRAEMSAQFIKDTFHLPVSVPDIIRRRAAIYADIRARGVPAMPGLQTLHAEIARRQIPWGVATSSPRPHAEEILDQLGLQETCGAIAAGTEVKAGKPAPDIYLLAAARLDVPPTACLALEDSGPGSQAAVAAGMRTVAIPNEQTKTADFSHAYAVYGSLHEALAHLDELMEGGV